jgi:hypothetical protein
MDALIVDDSSYGTPNRSPTPSRRASASVTRCAWWWPLRRCWPGKARNCWSSGTDPEATPEPGAANHARPSAPRKPARVQAVTFDTRYRTPRSLSGSAAHEAARRLRRTA